MTAGYMPDAVRHYQHTETERQRHAREPDANLRKRGGQHGASAAAKDQPERSDELCGGWPCVGHKQTSLTTNAAHTGTQDRCRRIAAIFVRRTGHAAADT